MFQNPFTEVLTSFAKVESFKTEGQSLTDKRKEAILKFGDKLLINNPSREIDLRKPTVLV